MEDNTIDPIYMNKTWENSSGSVSRYGGPEMDSKSDIKMHDMMRLKQNGMYGIPKFFVDGFAPSKWCPGGCGRLRVWCECVK